MGVSVIVYGRNDSHGYNLHKRAAISLNCIAQVLSEADDEILFVDYNTPDDLPTFPEAIQDTLTETAKRRIRVLRVRPRAHAAFAGRTHLEVLEPIARNIALRRSNPANRWVLSTNTDMIFVPQDGASLSQVIANLPDGFYHLPRFELPEGLWEGLDRREPQTILKEVEGWARDLHLRQVVHGSDTILYDAPGDFQLALREDLFRIDGFDENMILGWHVDSNLAKRMGLLRGAVSPVPGRLAGYHCDHTRLTSAVHGQNLPSNDSDRFVDGVTAAALPSQTETWGLPGADVETFDLFASPSSRYLAALQAALPEPQDQPSTAHYLTASFNRLTYDWRNALPFLLDAVAAGPPTQAIGCADAGTGLIEAFAIALEKLAPRARLLFLDGRGAPALPNVEVVAWDQWRSRPCAYIFEIGHVAGAPQHEAALRSGEVVSLFDRLVESRAGGPPTRVIAVNAVNTDFEVLLNRAASCAPTPFGSRIRHGYLKPRPVAAPEGAQLDPDVVRWAERFIGADRSPWALERAGILTVLDAAFGLGLGPRRPRVLLACHLPDALGRMLAHAGVEVDAIDPLALLGDPDARDWRGDLAHLQSFSDEPVGLMDASRPYDAVVCPQSALMIRGAAKAGELAARFDASLVEGGLLVFSLDSASHEGGVSEAFAAALGYQPAPSPDLGGEGPLLWSGRKGAGAAPDAGALAAAFRADLPRGGLDVSRRMQVKDWVEATSQGWRIDRDAPTGHALFGPYIALQGGRYRAAVAASAVGGGNESVLRLEVAVGGHHVLARRDYAARDLAGGQAILEFLMPAETEGLTEVRVVHLGRADLRIGAVVLSASSAGAGDASSHGSRSGHG